MSKAPLAPLTELDPAEAWKPWRPDAGDPWGPKWAGHLLRRAAFAPSWPELQAAVRAGPEAALDRLLAGQPGYEAFDELMDALAPESPVFQPGGDPTAGLQGWWLYRMVLTRHPLRERMTLFWHGHFATSIAKVRQPALMKEQNLLLRRHALGKFGPLLQEISRDPAMLVWLDSNSNVKSHPNENYARELMELFTMGTGAYTERDVQEAARAFTGWHTDGRQFRFDPYQHDDGPKTFLGRTGNWDGGDVVGIVLEQPATARFLVRKLYRQFLSEADSPPDALLEPLAERFRKSGYDVADLLRAMLASRHFFSAYAYRQRIKSPVELVVGLLRSLEAHPGPESPARPSPFEARLAGKPVEPVGSIDGLGQVLFAPPNVKGWDGGRAWLNSATVLARGNLALALLQGTDPPLGARCNLAALVRRHAGGKDSAGQVAFLLDLFLQPGPDDVPGPARRKLAEYLAEGRPQGDALERRLRDTAHLILLLPEYQLA